MHTHTCIANCCCTSSVYLQVDAGDVRHVLDPRLSLEQLAVALWASGECVASCQSLKVPPMQACVSVMRITSGELLRMTVSSCLSNPSCVQREGEDSVGPRLRRKAVQGGVC